MEAPGNGGLHQSVPVNLPPSYRKASARKPLRMSVSG